MRIPKPTPETIAAFEAQFEIDSPVDLMRQIVEEDYQRALRDKTRPSTVVSQKWRAWCRGPVGEKYYREEMHGGRTK